MCRAILEGGRRCPLVAANRSAKRRAAAAARRAGKQGPAGYPDTVIVSTPQPPGKPHETPEGRIELARAVSVVSAGVPSHMIGGDPAANAEAEGRNGLWNDARQWLAAEYGSTEQAVTALGNAVASRGEEIAGITGEQVREGHAARRAPYEAQLQEAEAEMSRLRAEGDRRANVAELEAQAHEAATEWQRVQKLPYQMRQQLDRVDGVTVAQKNHDDAQRALNKARHESYQYQQENGYDAVRDKAWAAEEKLRRTDPQTQRELAQLSAGYKAALAETRDMGGEHSWHPKSTAQAQAAFNEALDVYPTDWIEKSAARGKDPIVKIGRSRAHYSDGHVETTKRRVQRVSRHITDSDDISGLPEYMRGNDPEYEATLMWRPGQEDEEGNYMWDYTWEVKRYERYRTWSSHSWTREETIANKPRGNGWKLHEFTNRYGEQDVCWRRPATRMEMVSAESVAELRTSRDVVYAEGVSNTYSTSVHEMAHRMEASVPGIGALEEDFLRRRTTNADGERERLVEIYPKDRTRVRSWADGSQVPKRTEVGRKDDLIHHYMGKEYHGTNFREVMSTGTESLFAGEHGGLVGANKEGRADHDMRGFVLGTLASAGRKDQWDVDPPIRHNRDADAEWEAKRAERRARAAQAYSQ